MSEKATIGQILRGCREERGLTPEQAAFQSRIPLRLLQALESDDYRLLPDAAYLIRFLHDYARLLDLDPSPMEEDFRQTLRRPPRVSPAAPPPQPPLSIPWKQVLWTAVAILVVTPLVFIVLSLASKRSVERPGPPPVAERPVGDQAPGEAPAVPEGGGLASMERPLALRPGTARPEVAVGPAVQPEPSPGSPASAGPALQAPGFPAPLTEQRPRRFHLTARALEPTWMVVRADGGQDREVLLQKGQTARFTAETGFVVTLGNAGGVDLSLNGEPIPSLGLSGQVIRELAIPMAGFRQGRADARGAAAQEARPPGAIPLSVAPAAPER